MKTHVTVEEVQTTIAESQIFVAKMGNKTTVLTAVLPNGFEITVSSSCVDPTKYDLNIGEGLCRKRLEDKVWELLGYSLQQRLFEERQHARDGEDLP